MSKRRLPMPRVAIYAGSFDPPTLGHEDIALRAAPLFDTLYVAVGTNPIKPGFMNVETRLELLRESFVNVSNVHVVQFTGQLLVRFCDVCGARYIVRGARNAADFEYEQSIAHANKTQNSDIETVVLMTKPSLSFVSSSAVREIARYGGDVSQFVSPHVADWLIRHSKT